MPAYALSVSGRSPTIRSQTYGSTAAHHHVPAVPVRRDAIDGVRVAGQGTLVGDEDVAVEGQTGQRFVDLPVQVAGRHALLTQAVAVPVAVALLVGDDRLGHVAGAGEHRPPVPVIDQGADEPDLDPVVAVGAGGARPVAGEHTDTADPDPVGVQVGHIRAGGAGREMTQFRDAVGDGGVVGVAVDGHRLVALRDAQPEPARAVAGGVSEQLPPGDVDRLSDRGEAGQSVEDGRIAVVDADQDPARGQAGVTAGPGADGVLRPPLGGGASGLGAGGAHPLQRGGPSGGYGDRVTGRRRGGGGRCDAIAGVEAHRQRRAAVPGDLHEVLSLVVAADSPGVAGPQQGVRVVGVDQGDTLPGLVAGHGGLRSVDGAGGRATVVGGR